MKKDYYATFTYRCGGGGAWSVFKKKYTQCADPYKVIEKSKFDGCKLIQPDYLNAYDTSLDIVIECDGKLIYEGCLDNSNGILDFDDQDGIMFEKDLKALANNKNRKSKK